MSRRSAQSVLQDVRDLLPRIAEQAAEVDRTGAVSPDTVAALHEAGYFALLRPAEFGGLEADPEFHLTASRELAAACVSTGWLAVWMAASTWGLALRSPQAQADIWGTDPDALLCSSYSPSGQLQRVPGGYRVTGHWNRCIGAQHASWLNAAGLLLGPDGAAQDFVAVLVPSSDYVVESTWNGLGLKGIGASDIAVSDVFVPEHRTYSWMDSHRYDNAAPLYRLPSPTLYTLAGSLPLLGAAQRVLRDASPQAGTDSRAALNPLAMAEADVDLSVQQIHRDVADLMECVTRGEVPSAEMALRTRRDQVMAAERAMRAVRIVAQGDGGAATNIDPATLDRVWRDVLTARMHETNDVGLVLSVAGRHVLGINVDHLIW